MNQIGVIPLKDKVIAALEALQPCLQVHHHLLMIAEANLATPTVAATRINVERTTNVIAVQLCVEVYTISWWNSIVVVAECNESAWSHAAYVHVSTVFLLVTLAWIFTKEVLTTSVVSVTFHH